MTNVSQTEQAVLQQRIRLFRLLFYFFWVVAAGCAVGMFLVGSGDIGVGLLIALGIGLLGLIEFERFAKTTRRA